MENKHKIAKHNAKFARGEVSFKMGLNKYADMVSLVTCNKALTNLYCWQLCNMKYLGSFITSLPTL